jgi:hypothetical protein
MVLEARNSMTEAPAFNKSLLAALSYKIRAKKG